MRQWERWLGELNVLVAPVEPPAEIWNRIEPSLSRPPARLHAVRVYETPDLYVDYFGDAR